MSERPKFAHASEAELARILEYYQVAWEYEPRTFPIQWNLDGAVVESFSPDFYLPELDLYVELTTLRQSLVRRKNRKLRRLRELYPDVRAKLFYGKDFKALMLKYGRFDVAASLSGLEGQNQADADVLLAVAESRADLAQPAVDQSQSVDGEAPQRTDPDPLPSSRRRRARPSRGSRRRRGRRNYINSTGT